MKWLRLAIVACLALGVSSAGAQTHQWKLASPYGPNDATTLWLQEFAKDVAEKTNGRLNMEVVLLGALGFKPADSLRVLKQDVVEAIHITPFVLVRDEPLIANLLPSHTVLEPEENFKAAEVQIEIANEIYADWNAIMIAPQAPSTLAKDLIIVTKDPVNTLEGLRGKKIRAAGRNEMAAFNALGVAAQNMAANEIYLALKTGVIDGAVFVRSFVKSQSLDEVACCYAVISPFPAAMPIGIVANRADWQDLPEDVRQTVTALSRQRYLAERQVWLDGVQDKKAAAELNAAGVRELEAYPLADRKILRDAVFAEWKTSTEKLGDRALGYYERVNKALTAE